MLIVVDLFAPERMRPAVSQAEVLLNTVCSKPWRRAADLVIAVGKRRKLIKTNDVIEHVFHPVTCPEENAPKPP
ncbi:MAG: hypothetical protein EOO23_03130 [Comamonadaceae bacterium]|nr:MAG: hypothetical protein EOO23_03130 [Comamonadaceae bacterium]